MSRSPSITLLAFTALTACHETAEPVARDLNALMAEPGWITSPPFPEYREESRRLVQGEHLPGGCSISGRDSSVPPAGREHVTWSIAKNPETCQWILADGTAPAALFDREPLPGTTVETVVSRP